MELPHCQYFFCMVLLRLSKKSFSVVCVDSFPVQLFYKRNVSLCEYLLGSHPQARLGSDKLALGASKTMFKPGLSGSLNLHVTFMRLTRFGLLFGTCYGLWSGMSQMGGRNRPCRLRHGSVATWPVEQDGSLTALLPRKQMHFRVGTLHIARSLGTPSMPTPQFGSQGHQLFVT